MGWIEHNRDNTRHRPRYRIGGKRGAGPWCEYRHEAEEWLAENEPSPAAKAQAPLPARPTVREDLTLATFSEEWLASHGDAIGRETYRAYRTHVTLGILEDEIGQILMADLDREDVKAWLVRMDPRGAGARNGSLKVLRMICRAGLGSRRIPMTVDPTWKIKRRRRERRAVDHPSGKTGDRVFLAPEDVEALLDVVAEDETFTLLVLLGVFAGLRWSEMAALSVDQIRKTGDGMTIEVNRSVRDGVVVNDTKNHVDRTVPVLEPRLRAALLAATRRARLRGAGDGRGALLMVATTRRQFGKLTHRANGKIQASVPITGTTRRIRRECETEAEAWAWISTHAPAPKPLDYADWLRRFNDAIQEAGIYPVPLGWHDLRHTCASQLSADGVQPAVVAEVLGHKTLAITATYTHVPQRVVDAAMREAYARRSA